MKSRDRSWLSVIALLVLLSITVSGYERPTTSGDSPPAETMESVTSQDPFPWSDPGSVGLNAQVFRVEFTTDMTRAKTKYHLLPCEHLLSKWF